MATCAFIMAPFALSDSERRGKKKRFLPSLKEEEKKWPVLFSPLSLSCVPPIFEYIF